MGRVERTEKGTHATTAAVAAVRCAPRRPSVRSPPQKQYFVPRVVKREQTTVEKEKAKQRSETFLGELEGRVASVTDEELARLERIMERRSRTAVPAIVAQIGTALAQPSYL